MPGEDASIRVEKKAKYRPAVVTGKDGAGCGWCRSVSAGRPRGR